MKKPLVMLALFTIIILPLISATATIILEQQPKTLYNLGEKLEIPIMVTSNQGTYDFLDVSLLCDNQEYKFPKDSIGILAGEVQKVDKSVFLFRKFIGTTKGLCKVKAVLE